MSETWKVQLVFSDDRSNKFWRGRTEGSTMYVNYGRIGTNGQTQVKEFGSPQDADAALAKQAQGKRRKGYVDDGGAPSAEPLKETAPALPDAPESINLALEQGGRNIELTLSYDGTVVKTEVAETFASRDQAAAAFVRIQQALLAEGYKTSS